MVRIAIVEDDKKYQEQINDYLLRYQKEFEVQIEISTFEDGTKIEENYRPVFDIILMDIEMPLMDGMTAAKRIRSVDSEVVIIFITNMAKYAIRGYEVHALDFVLKPINYFMFILKMDNAMKMVHRKEGKCLLLNLENGIKKLSTGDIYYIEVINHSLYYHTIEGVIRYWGTLKDIETQLEGVPFKRCNTCYLVNLKYVSGVLQNTVVVAGEKLQLSRSKKKEFMQAVANYIGGIK